MPFAVSVKFVMTVSPGKTGTVSPVTACPVHDTPDGSGTPEWFSTPKKYCDWITHSAAGGGRKRRRRAAGQEGVTCDAAGVGSSCGYQIAGAKYSRGAVRGAQSSGRKQAGLTPQRVDDVARAGLVAPRLASAAAERLAELELRHELVHEAVPFG